MMINSQFFFNNKYRQFGVPHFYPFPCQLRDLPRSSGLSPLFHALVGRSEAEVREILKSEWSAIRSPAVARLRDLALRYCPVALARTYHPVYTVRTWFLLFKSDRDPRQWFFVEQPTDPAVLEAALDRFAVVDRDVLREFYHHFHGLVEQGPGYSGFYRVPEWHPFEAMGHYGSGGYAADPERKWADALVVYSTSTGDGILLKYGARSVAWHASKEHLIVPLATSFSGFLKTYTRELKDSSELEYYMWKVRHPSAGDL
jgi:hypothetical protein